MWEHLDMAVLSVQPTREPLAVDQRSSSVGLRTVASFEAIKGIAVLVLGVTLLAVHQNAEDYAANLLYHLHIDPDRRLAHVLMDAATKVSDARLWTIAAAALSYASVRFIESWGLWNRRVWAEWFALLSGAMYLPWEILKVAERADWERTGVLAINLIIVAYMLFIRLRASRAPMGNEQLALKSI
jgi:uncharacterized membrane protein (DUF2068 family)